MFEERIQNPELLDDPDADPSLAERGYRFMKFVNRAGGGIRVVRKFIEDELQGSGETAARILDLGSGDCDIPLEVIRWANEQGYTVEFTCIDHNRRGIDLAREALSRRNIDAVELVENSIFSYQPVREFDYAVGSMFFHHLAFEQIRELIELLRGYVRRAVLINDLHRCALNYLVCCLLTLGIQPEIRRDALISVRQGFKPDELLRALLTHGYSAGVQRRWFRRVAGVVRFDRAAAA